MLQEHGFLVHRKSPSQTGWGSFGARQPLIDLMLAHSKTSSRPHSIVAHCRIALARASLSDRGTRRLLDRVGETDAFRPTDVFVDSIISWL